MERAIAGEALPHSRGRGLKLYARKAAA